jgi:Tfp pilus assembly protein FimV
MALGAVALVVTGAGIMATGPSGNAPAAPSQRKAVTIQAGDTLWDVASKHAPANMDTRVYLDAILELNGIGVVVDPGTRIRLP